MSRDRPRARNTDPSTSHAAAASVEGHITTAQSAVWSVMIGEGGMTDEELIHLYNARRASVYGSRLPKQSDSGLRTRRAELVDQGRVVDTGLRKTLASGRKSIVWRAVRGIEIGRPFTEAAELLRQQREADADGALFDPNEGKPRRTPYDPYADG